MGAWQVVNIMGRREVTTAKVMKWLIALCVLAVGVQAEFPTKEFIESLKPVVEKCEANTGVDKGLVDEFSKGTMVDDDKLKVTHINDKMNRIESLLNSAQLPPTAFEIMLYEMYFPGIPSYESTGLFRYEKMLSMMPQEMKSVAYEMGRNCIHFKGEGGADLCQVSFDLHRCWQKADPEHYFLM